MTTHTPGPWIWRSTLHTKAAQFIYGADLVTLAEVRLTLDDQAPHPPLVAESEANARLIAASPTMLAALQTALVELEGAVYKGLPAHVAHARDQVRAAIALATGQK